MKHFYTIVATLLMLTACGSKYNIQGQSSITALDGHKLYLDILQDNELKAIDSCEVIHGQFHFSGPFEQVAMAHIFMDDQQLIPLILEDGEIHVNLDLAQQTATGTPLNDSLASFRSQYNQIQNMRSELVHRHDQAIMDGSNMDLIYINLAADENRLAQQEDSLLTNFITSNFDNVLGTSIFFLMTMNMQYPQLTPWVEYIMSKATDNFKADPYVKDYYEKAQENQKIMNGMATPKEPAPTEPQPEAPTPNELAQPQPMK